MGQDAIQHHFHVAPGVWRYYPRALFARRVALLPAGVTVPRLEADVDAVEIRRGHLQRYREVCGFAANGRLPVTYPHVLAMSLHLALMTHPRFVVRLLGLIHIANFIEQFRPLREDARLRMHCWVEGCRDGDRGQEFELMTEFHDRDGLAWRERCTLLARRAGGSAQATRAARAMLRHEKPQPDDTVRVAPFHADRRAGRRYGRVSGDLNPIHLADAGARLFGFDRAVAHGMWSMARSLAALDAGTWDVPAAVDVQFKLPLFLPSGVQLHHWRQGDRTLFVLKDAAGARPHLAGSVSRPATAG
jgi:acyl dehydratase